MKQLVQLRNHDAGEIRERFDPASGEISNVETVIVGRVDGGERNSWHSVAGDIDGAAIEGDISQPQRYRLGLEPIRPAAPFHRTLIGRGSQILLPLCFLNFT